MRRERTATEHLRRVKDRALRELIVLVPPVGALVRTIYTNRIRRYRPHLKPLSEAQQRLLAEVAEAGIAKTSLDELAMPGTDALKASLTRLHAGLAARPPSEPSPVRPGREELLSELDVWRWGLQDEVLDIVEQYLGLAARYYGADVRREGVDGDAIGVRCWHLDIEDHRVFKIIVWLDDVGATDGPYEWVPRELTDATIRSLRYVGGFVQDSDMAKAASPALWRSADGARWTALLTDTRSVFHRAGAPVHKDRFSVTFTWVSRHPLKRTSVAPFSAEEIARYQRGLNARQVACLPPSLS